MKRSYAGPVWTEISTTRQVFLYIPVSEHRRNVFNSFGDETCGRIDFHVMRPHYAFSAKQNVGPTEQFIFAVAGSMWQFFKWRLPTTPPSSPKRQILTEVVIEIWDCRVGEYYGVTSCSLVGRYRRFGGNCCLCSEDGFSRFIRNVAAYPDYTTTHTRNTYSWNSASNFINPRKRVLTDSSFPIPVMRHNKREEQRGLLGVADR